MVFSRGHELLSSGPQISTDMAFSGHKMSNIAHQLSYNPELRVSGHWWITISGLQNAEE